MIVYPVDRLYEELAYLGLHMHWTYTELAQMDHQQRQRWVHEVETFNSRLTTRPEATR
jgi:hypothetical protein